jgi:TolB-like protein
MRVENPDYRWKIGELELDRRSFSLRRNGVVVRLDTKPLELLLLLVEKNGAVISHDEAVRTVWGEGVFLNGEAAIYTAVKKIRQALGDSTLIETVPGKGYRIRADVKAIAQTRAKSEAVLLPTEPEERLAILPLLNLSNDPEQDYFSDGLTEELINTVSRLLRGHMSVIARTSVMRFRAVSKPVQDIAQELHADYLVEGSVRRHSNRVRIAVQLIRAADGTSLWGESFERALDDVLALQSEIALATATAIGLRISPQSIAGAERSNPPLINVEVHDRFLRARHLISQRTRPALQNAVRYLRETLAIDPIFAPALSSLAFCYAILPITSLLRSHDCFPLAQELAAQALERDPLQSDAHVALGLVDFWYHRHWTEARRHFDEAAISNPADSAPPMFLAHIHSVLGEHEDALTALGGALRLDPISPIVRTHHGHFLYNAGHSHQAIPPLDQVLELAPQFWIAHLMRGKALATADHSPSEPYSLPESYPQAIESFLSSERSGMGNTEPLAFRIHALATSGQTQAAREAMEEMELAHSKTPVPPLHRALARLGIGDRETARELLEEAFAERDVRLIFLLVESRWKGLGDEFHSNAIQRAGLPQSRP